MLVPTGSPLSRPRATWRRAASPTPHEPRPFRHHLPEQLRYDIRGGEPRGVLPQRRVDPTQAAHPAPHAAGRAVLRGADGRGRILLGLLAALPPRHPVGGGGCSALGAGRPVAV